MVGRSVVRLDRAEQALSAGREANPVGVREGKRLERSRAVAGRIRLIALRGQAVVGGSDRGDVGAERQPVGVGQDKGRLNGGREHQRIGIPAQSDSASTLEDDVRPGQRGRTNGVPADGHELVVSRVPVKRAHQVRRSRSGGHSSGVEHRNGARHVGDGVGLDVRNGHYCAISECDGRPSGPRTSTRLALTACSMLFCPSATCFCMSVSCFNAPAT